MPVTPSQTNRFSNDCTDLVSQPQVPIRTLFLLWERSSAALTTPGWMIGPCQLGNPAPAGGPGTARVSGSKLHVTAVAHGVQPGSAHAVRMPWPASGIGEPEDHCPPGVQQEVLHRRCALQGDGRRVLRRSADRLIAGATAR